MLCTITSVAAVHRSVIICRGCHGCIFFKMQRNGIFFRFYEVHNGFVKIGPLDRGFGTTRGPVVPLCRAERTALVLHGTVRDGILMVALHGTVCIQRTTRKRYYTIYSRSAGTTLRTPSLTI